MGDTIQERIEGPGKGLAEGARRTFRKLKKKIKKAEKSLVKAQKCFPDARILQTCNDISNKQDNLHLLNESYWFMHARANELKDGDRDTNTFTTKPARGEEETLSRA